MLERLLDRCNIDINGGYDDLIYEPVRSSRSNISYQASKTGFRVGSSPFGGQRHRVGNQRTTITMMMMLMMVIIMIPKKTMTR